MTDAGANIRFTLCVLGVAALHFMASFMLAFIGGISGGLSNVMANILLFPLSVVAPDDVFLSWAAWVTVSLLWGLGMCLLVRYVRQTRA